MTRSPRKLDLAAILATSETLAQRVDDRFPERGISTIAGELVLVGSETCERVDRLARPRWILRLLIGALIVVGIVSVVMTIVVVDPHFEVDGVSEWLALLENGIQDLVFLGIAGFFVITAERRLKRREALEGLHQLRSLAHVIDMHQLTKDPASAYAPNDRTAHSPERPDDPAALEHYLDYCSEMLSITNKFAALYAQESQDSVVLAAVTSIQDLTTSLSSKLWQKIMILQELRESH